MTPPVLVPALRFREGRTGGQRVWEALVDHWIARGFRVVSEDAHPVSRFLADRPGLLALRQLGVYGAHSTGVLVADQAEAGVLRLLARVLRRRRHVRIVVVVHHLLEVFHYSWPGYVRLARGNETAMLRLAHRVIVHTREEADRVHARGVPRERLTVIPLGHRAVETPTPLRMLSPEEPLRLLWVGGDFARKGLPVLLRAMAATSPRPTLTVAGEPHDPAIFRAAREQVDALGLRDAVTFRGTIRDRAALEREWHAHDAYVLPSRHEGHGLAVDEALLHGMPAVLSDLPVFRERLGPEDARFVPVDDVEALARALAALRDPDLRRRLSEAGLRRAATFPRWEATLLRYEEVLREEMART